MKKLFGGLNLTWPKVIIGAIIFGIYGALVCMIPILRNSSFHNSAVSFEIWILLGIILIMNSKKPLDSALKCFVFFLISQPLIYLIQDVINHSNLFSTYYRFWILWTLACLPMGFVGYYMKKDKWWGVIILSSMLVFLYIHYQGFLSTLFFTFPVNLISTLFCLITMIILPIAIFENKTNKYFGLAISIILITVGTIIAFTNPYVYDTDLFANSEEHPINDSCKAYLTDSKYGTVEIKMEPQLDDWVVKAHFKKTGKTQLVLVDKDQKETRYDINIISTDKYDYELAK